MLPTSILKTYTKPPGTLHVMYLNTPENAAQESLRRRNGKGKLHQDLQASNFSDTGATAVRGSSGTGLIAPSLDIGGTGLREPYLQAECPRLPGVCVARQGTLISPCSQLASIHWMGLPWLKCLGRRLSLPYQQAGT